MNYAPATSFKKSKVQDLDSEYLNSTIEDSRAKQASEDCENYKKNFIKEHNLRELNYKDHDFEYYLDGTKYYTNDANEVYRITLSKVIPGPHKKRA